MTKFVACCALTSALVIGLTTAVVAQDTAVVRQASPLTIAQRYESALTYEQFTADSARHDEWVRNFERASAPVLALRERARALRGRWHLLVVAESWCRDAVNSVPYLARLAAENPAIELRLLRSSDAKDLLDAHPLEGRAATPLVLVYDEQFVERGVWIERPAALRALIKSKEGRTCEDALREDVARWRAADGGRSVLAEVIGLMEGESRPVQPDSKPATMPR